SGARGSAVDCSCVAAGGSGRRRAGPGGEPVAVYLACGRWAMFGPGKTVAGNGESLPGSGIQDSFLMLADKAGLEMKIPEGIDQLCCGTPWTSKGMVAGEKTI